MLNQLFDSGRAISASSDVQQTTFSKDGLARYVCNTFEEVLDAQRKGNWQFDIVIVGSGMYGSFLAAKIESLRKKHLKGKTEIRTLVLEAGPFFITEHVQNMTRMGNFEDLVKEPLMDESKTFFTQTQSPRPNGLDGLVPHHRCIGGKSMFWGGWSPRLTQEDLSRLDANEIRLWPEEVVDFLNGENGYPFIEEQIGANVTSDFVSGPYHNFIKKKIKSIITRQEVPALSDVVDAPLAVQAESPASGLFSMDKFSSLPLLITAVRDDNQDVNAVDQNRHIFIVPNAEVIKLDRKRNYVSDILIALKDIPSQNNGFAQQTRVVNLPLKDGAVVVLAGNTVNSTRLALTSLRADLNPSSHLMGNNLMAHVRGNYVWRVHRQVLTNVPVGNPLKEFATSTLHIPGSVTTTTGVTGNFHLQFYSVGGQGTNPEEFLYRYIPNLDDINAVKSAIDTTNIMDWVIIGIRSCGEMFGSKQIDKDRRDKSFFSVSPFGGNDDDVYSFEGKEIRVPKAFMCLVQTPAIENVRLGQRAAAFKLIEALVGGSQNAADREKLQLIEAREDAMGSTYHESGTLWIGTDPDDSVTDVNGKIHHTANVYCVDQSLFPTVGSANPVPTGLALTNKVARHLIDRFIVTPAQEDPSFQKIFDGTLDGWRAYRKGSFNALPGLAIIEGDSNGPNGNGLGFLRYEKQQFENFVLKLEYKTFSWETNSGIFLRMPDVSSDELNSENDNLYNKSIEIQIDDTGEAFAFGRVTERFFGSARHKTGSIYGRAYATSSPTKAISARGSDGYWNLIEITVNGRQVSVSLNKLKVSETILTDDISNGGFIGLQFHTNTIQFRSVQIKQLP